ncbi:small secreted protein [Kitasatospora sp. NBC_00315]|uniref:small secreted protein n=1 Tax=Kitasatospora sp. NBC_00315 TaxID=2975963 RepID=UPI0032540F41
MNKRQLAVPALGALLALGAVGCGGDNSAQQNAWATGVCDAAKDPIAQAQAALGDTGQVKAAEVPADLQKRLSADVARLAKTNQQIAEAIDKAGAPKVDNGAGLQKDAVDELNRAAQGYLDVQKKLDALPTTDQAKFADGLRSVGDQVQQLATLSTQAQNKLQTGELGAAMAKQPGCKPVPAGANAASGSPASGSPAAVDGTVTTPGATPGAAGTPAADGASPSATATDAGAPAASPSSPTATATAPSSPTASAG